LYRKTKDEINEAALFQQPHSHHLRHPPLNLFLLRPNQLNFLLKSYIFIEHTQEVWYNTNNWGANPGGRVAATESYEVDG
jgi:hypothetical protein